MYCKNCGTKIPADSKTCPECGEHLTTEVAILKSKKNIFIIGMTLTVICLLLIGVGYAVGSHSNNEKPAISNNQQTKGNSQKSSQVKGEKPPVELGQPLDVGTFELTAINRASSKTVSDSSGFGGYKADGTFVIVSVKYKNISNERHSLDDFNFTLTSNGKTYSSSQTMDNKDLHHVSANPGIEKIGWVLFDVPEDVANDNFTLKVVNTRDNNFNGSMKLYK